MAKFLFERSFETRDGEPPPRPKPTFTEGDLADAEARGFEAGQTAGYQAARGEIDAAAASALQAMQQEIAAFTRAHAAAFGQRQSDTAQLAFRIAAKLAPALMQRHPLAEVEALVEQCLSDLTEEPRIVVRTSEMLATALQPRLDGLVAATGFPGTIVLLPDDRLDGSDCRVEWADGGAERNSAALGTQIEAAVTRFLDASAAGPGPEPRPTGEEHV